MASVPTIKYLVDQGAKVISMSLGGSELAEVEKGAIDRAIANGTSVDEATVRTQAITAAYRTLMQARGWSSAGARS